MIAWVTCYLFCIITLIKNAQVSSVNIEQMLNDSRVSVGPYFQRDRSGDHGLLKYGKLVDCRKGECEMEMFTIFSKKYGRFVSGNTDGEDIDAIERYFWGMSNGIVIELGALDGLSLSVSRALLDIGWHRILIEGASIWREGLIANSPDAYSFNAAICDQPQLVHYSRSHATGGIVEFMSDSFRAMLLRSTTVRPQSEWHLIPGIDRISCLPLRFILHDIHCHHVNLWILDVEGAEMNILQTVDWENTKFDVIAIETDTAFRPIGYETNVTVYMNDKGYIKDWSLGRNTWYIRHDFNPSGRLESERYTMSSGLHNYPDMTCVKLEGYLNKEIFVIQNRTRHTVPDYDTFLALKLDKTQTINLNAEQMAAIPLGAPLQKIELK